MKSVVLFCAFLAGSVSMAFPAKMSPPTVFYGMCDASAAVALTTNLFVVANDEDNFLRIYRSDEGGMPVRMFDIGPFLRVEGTSLESDIEGAARLGDRIYWITSHGRNKSGKLRLNRARLFATDIEETPGGIELKPAGRSYTRLLQDLIKEPRLRPYQLEAASRLAPKERGALNIEGLAATPEGHLLIGFRNPIPEGKALLVPLLHPDRVVAGKPAQFGPPILIDLGGLGIRSIEFWNGNYYIIAGPHDGGQRSKLYVWSGGPEDKPREIEQLNFAAYNPEAILFYPRDFEPKIQVLSDDGTMVINGVACKDLPNPLQRQFRGVWITLP
jgi:hypothetical protein